MIEVLIVHASRHGHTARIARHLADELAERGASVLLAPLHEATALRIEDFDGVIVGGSVHMGNHDPKLLAWVRAHLRGLERVPSAFFSVSLTAATDSDEGGRTAREYIDRFVEESDWTPWRSIPVAGALQYPAYSFMTRQLVRQIAAHKGLSTDLSRETAYTNWAALDAFAARFIEKFTPEPRVHAHPERLDRVAALPVTS